MVYSTFSFALHIILFSMSSTVSEADLKRNNAAAKQYVQQRHNKWLEIFPWNNSTWLATRTVNGIFCVGCHPCAIARADNKYARFEACTKADVSQQHLRYHHNSKQHQHAMLATPNQSFNTGDPGDEDSFLACAAPPPSEFEQIIKAASKESLSNLGSSKKLHAMEWCLKEAKMDMERELVVKQCHYKTSVLTQDARKNKLVARLSITGSRLHHDTFCLGETEIQGTDSFAVRDATERIIEDFATPRKDPPAYGSLYGRSFNPLCNYEVKSELCRSVEAICTDAASDEFRTGRLLTGESSSSFTTPILDQVKLHVRDPTHASTRFVETWKHDEYLKWLFGIMVWNTDSISSLITNSDDINRIWEERVKASEESQIDGTRIKNLKFIRPRFNSTNAPLCRLVLFNEAVIATCSIVIVVRAGTVPAETTTNFLTAIDEEGWVQSGMMADASDESIQVTRFFDTGDLYQLTLMPAELHAFVLHIEYLFCSRPAGCMNTGFTFFAVESMQRARVVRIGNRTSQ